MQKGFTWDQSEFQQCVAADEIVSIKFSRLESEFRKCIDLQDLLSWKPRTRGYRIAPKPILGKRVNRVYNVVNPVWPLIEWQLLLLYHIVSTYERDRVIIWLRRTNRSDRSWKMVRDALRFVGAKRFGHLKELYIEYRKE